MTFALEIVGRHHASPADESAVTAPRFAQARVDDIEEYVECAADAQAQVKRWDLAQWVPAAHATFLPALHAKVAAGTLRRAILSDRTVAFFDLSFEPSEWWPRDETAAAYLSGIVVSARARHCGVRAAILDFASKVAQERGLSLLRLDCHAGNDWLCRYYESHRFTRRGAIGQYPGYVGALYENCA